MSTFTVKVRTASGSHSFDQIGQSAGDVAHDVAARFGQCGITVLPK